MPPSVVGIAWYRNAEEYDELKAAFPDGDLLPDTFEEWLKLAQMSFDTLAVGGIVVVRAYIDPETFPEWCRDRGLEMDTAARMEFGNQCAFEHQRRCTKQNP